MRRGGVRENFGKSVNEEKRESARRKAIGQARKTIGEQKKGITGGEKRDSKVREQVNKTTGKQRSKRRGDKQNLKQKQNTGKKNRTNKTLSGNYTVEAAILMPLILFIVAACIHTGIDFHQEVISSIKECEAVKAERSVEKVRFLLSCENLLEELEWK